MAPFLLVYQALLIFTQLALTPPGKVFPHTAGKHRE
jgi:hypothetical protein